jgi:hypothetical protein
MNTPDPIDAYVEMIKEAGRLAHRSWRVSDYDYLETSRGVAFTCVLNVDATKVADVEHRGDGGEAQISWTKEARADGTAERFRAEAESLFPTAHEYEGIMVEALIDRQRL